MAAFSDFNTPRPFKVQGFITCYFGIVFAVVTFMFWEELKRTSIVKAVAEDLISGEAEVDAEYRQWDEEPAGERANMTWIGRFWDS